MCSLLHWRGRPENHSQQLWRDMKLMTWTTVQLTWTSWYSLPHLISHTGSHCCGDSNGDLIPTETGVVHHPSKSCAGWCFRRAIANGGWGATIHSWVGENTVNAVLLSMTVSTSHTWTSWYRLPHLICHTGSRCCGDSSGDLIPTITGVGHCPLVGCSGGCSRRCIVARGWWGATIHNWE